MYHVPAIQLEVLTLRCCTVTGRLTFVDVLFDLHTIILFRVIVPTRSTSGLQLIMVVLSHYYSSVPVERDWLLLIKGCYMNYLSKPLTHPEEV